MSSREYLKEMGLAVKESKSRGRFLVTEKLIPEGTTIMECMPLSWAVTNECATSICHHCLKSFEKTPCCESAKSMTGNVTNWSAVG
ncbi:uncharacterized protein [Blastocystis hominis]|uniref:Uncharacterized protein n=1 Tax=Blastocystis hominis TaxID=12968 RepID=D8M878_BLAHO|nr:uncharacterized protein [Blastocystis hominis]CBK24267.2 unnamed protein product [Blastocystis hominis]|eukprot:XP_012898315.1 uncharacterized protein [Blastocystis hominis]